MIKVKQKQARFSPAGSGMAGHGIRQKRMIAGVFCARNFIWEVSGHSQG